MTGRFGLPTAAQMAARRVVELDWEGQSNALCQSDSRTNLNRWAGPHTSPLVRAYKDTEITVRVVDSWGALRESQPVASGGSGWAGHDLVCCMDLVRNYGLRPKLRMVAKGATSLYADWNPSGGAMWARLVAAHAAADAADPDPTPSSSKVCVWIQAESDAPNAAYVNYGVNLAAYFAARRAMTGRAAMKFVVPLLHPSCGIPGSTPATVASIIQQQINVCAADTIGARVVQVSDLALQGDNLHYTEAAYITLGKRCAAGAAASV